MKIFFLNFAVGCVLMTSVITDWNQFAFECNLYAIHAIYPAVSKSNEITKNYFVIIWFAGLMGSLKACESVTLSAYFIFIFLYLPVIVENVY